MDTPGIVVIGGLTAILTVLFSTMTHGLLVGGMCLILNVGWAYFSLAAMAEVLP